MLHQSFLHFRDTVSNLTIVFGIQLDLVFFMCAFRLGIGVARGIRVILVKHDTIVDLEVPSRAHPATFAAPVLVVLSKINIVLIIGCQGAINELLLREANRRFVSLLGNCALEGGVCTESPTRAAISLILDCMHEAILKVIHSGSSLNATVSSIVKLKSSSLCFCLLCIKAKEVKIF